jgi:hypothetical protein
MIGRHGSRGVQVGGQWETLSLVQNTADNEVSLSATALMSFSDSVIT